MEPTNTYTIPASAWPEFEAKIAKLNRKAAKLGCEPIRYEVTGETIVEMSHHARISYRETASKTYKVPARIVTLHGSAPKVEGFEFVAKIEYLSDNASMLFHTVPGTDVKIDERFRTLTPATCEHCNKIRRRNETFVVRNTTTGQQTQVGRQCLADFTGINSPEKIAAKAAILSVFSDLRDETERMWGAHFAETIDTMEALALTSAYIAANGWTPRSATQFGGRATANDVADHFWAAVVGDARKAEMTARSEAAETEVHQDRASRTIAWIKNELAHTARSDYERNIITLVAGDLTERKHLGIVCSAVAAYQRAMNKAVEYAKRKTEKTNSQHVGKIGERIRDVPAKVEFVRGMASDFGPSTLVKFVTDAGDVLTWFAASDRDYTPGQSCRVTGTVKAHKEYQGIRETQLSRAVVTL